MSTTLEQDKTVACIKHYDLRKKKFQHTDTSNLKRFEQIELQVKLLNYFLGSNKSNINQRRWRCSAMKFGWAVLVCVTLACAAADSRVECEGFALPDAVYECPSGQHVLIAGKGPSGIFGQGSTTADSRVGMCRDCSPRTFSASLGCETSCTTCAEGLTSGQGWGHCANTTGAPSSAGAASSTGVRAKGAVGLVLAVWMLAPLCFA